MAIPTTSLLKLFINPLHIRVGDVIEKTNHKVVSVDPSAWTFKIEEGTLVALVHDEKGRPDYMRFPKGVSVAILRVCGATKPSDLTQDEELAVVRVVNEKARTGDTLSNLEIKVMCARYAMMVRAMSGIPEYGAVCRSAIFDYNRLRETAHARGILVVEI